MLRKLDEFFGWLADRLDRFFEFDGDCDPDSDDWMEN